MFPVVSVPGPQTHGTSLVSILIVTLAKFARASVNLSCWRSLTPLGVNVTSPAHLQVSEEETAMPAPRPSHCRRLGEGSSGCSGTIFSTRANSWELTSTKPLTELPGAGTNVSPRGQLREIYCWSIMTVTERGSSEQLGSSLRQVATRLMHWK